MDKKTTEAVAETTEKKPRAPRTPKAVNTEVQETVEETKELAAEPAAEPTVETEEKKTYVAPETTVSDAEEIVETAIEPDDETDGEVAPEAPTPDDDFAEVADTEPEETKEPIKAENIKIPDTLDKIEQMAQAYKDYVDGDRPVLFGEEKKVERVQSLVPPQKYTKKIVLSKLR